MEYNNRYNSLLRRRDKNFLKQIEQNQEQNQTQEQNQEQNQGKKEERKEEVKIPKNFKEYLEEFQRKNKNKNKKVREPFVCDYYGNFIFYISLNYNTFEFFQYQRYCPNYFRSVPIGSPSDFYESVIVSSTPQGACLRQQLDGGQIQLYSLEELFVRLVPSIYDTEDIVLFKDNIRNEFFAFVLNIEKSALFYNEQRLTCNNTYVPWNAYYDINIISDFGGENFTRANNIPLTQAQQTSIYNLSIIFFSRYFEGNRNVPFIILSILKIVEGGTLTSNITEVNFYTFVYISLILLNFLYSTSKKLLLGLTPGLPQDFINIFFPVKRQIYYNGLYMSWLVSRSGYLGFGDSINTSNGDGTYIPVPIGPNNIPP